MLNASFSQVNQLPYENPNNSLDLKIVTQEYTRVTTNQYGGVVSKENKDFYLLKVNDLYLADNDTGINERSFKGFLSNCPKSLDVAKNSLNTYDKAYRSEKLRNRGAIAMFIAAAYFAFNAGDSKTNGYLAGGMLVGGLTYGYVMKGRSNKLKRKAQGQVLDAFNIYQESCYEPLPDSDKSTGPLSPSTTEESNFENGQSNEGEEIRIEVLANQTESTLFTLNALGEMTVLDKFVMGYGLDLGIYRKGFYVNATVSDLSFDLGNTTVEKTEREYLGKINVGIPLLRKTVMANDIVNVGTAYGIAFTGTLTDTKIFSALSLDGGLQQYQMYGADNFEVKDYFTKTTIARGGLSYNMFTYRKYKVLDERFSNKVQTEMRHFRFFANVLYNLENEYQLFPSNSFLTENDPSFKEIGFVGGLKAALNRPAALLLNVDLEIGKYPIHNEFNGLGGSVRIGIGLYKVK